MLTGRLTFSLDIGPVLDSTGEDGTAFTADEGKAVEGIRIEDITLSLLQTWTISSISEPEIKEEMPEQAFLLWSLGEATQSTSKQPLFSSEQLLLQPGQSRSIEQRILLPDNPAIRPSVSPLSKTGLRPSHRLSLVVTYSPLLRGPSRSVSRTREDKASSEMRIYPGKKKEIVVSTPVTLSTCACVFYALRLPAYGDADYEDFLRHEKACDERNKACKLFPLFNGYTAVVETRADAFLRGSLDCDLQCLRARL